MLIEHNDAAMYFDKPTAEWTFRELTDVLGVARVTELLGISAGNVRVLRYRGATNLERMQTLRDAVDADREKLRNRIATILIGRNARRTHTPKEPTNENNPSLGPRPA